MTPDAIIAKFQPPKQSIRWAENAINEFDTAAKTFFENDVTETVIYIDTQTGHNVEKVRLKRNLPDELARKATEAISSLKGAFDQMIFSSNAALGRSRKDSVYFPWADSHSEFEGFLKRRNIDERLWDTLRKHEPYKRSDAYPGGDDVCRALAKIANGKHTIGLTVFGDIRFVRPPAASPIGPFFGIRTPKWDAEKNEAELARWTGNPQMQGEYKIGFQIVLKDSWLPTPVNAVVALRDFTAKANAVIEGLQARCLEIAASAR